DTVASRGARPACLVRDAKVGRRNAITMTTLERIPSGVTTPTTTVADVMSLAREAGVLIVDLRFVDLPGQSQHFSIPVKDLGEGLVIDGIGFGVSGHTALPT